MEIVEWKTKGKNMLFSMGRGKWARYGLMLQIRSISKTAIVLLLAWLGTTGRKTLGRLTTSLLGGGKAGGGGYERVGVGKVEAQYVSRDCIAGTLW